ncbi:MAG: bifunctional proline dehydrogenase/L-glutamate gamma-semialdehyde dehydrogenase PutA [Proteobacteria bacterium]|nr:bifunctional proline dehydrogenase/L-glutamate gamma-semialdehyde dehydrogenase PutA [Pseudomonadota bacterium]
MIFADEVFSRDRLRARIGAQYRADETAMVEALIKQARLGATADKRIARTARKLVSGVREKRVRAGGIDAFLHEYGLSNREGIVLMCLAEALLRIPDAKTANRLIRDKIGGADWMRHLGHSDSLLVNASTWGLILTGRVVRLDSEEERDVFGLLGRLVARSGEPVIRQSINAALGILSRQYVMGRTIEDALDRAAAAEEAGYTHSYDMLGEAALTAADAGRYFDAYAAAIAAIGARADDADPVAAPSVSVKLSALHPRYQFAQWGRVVAELAEKLLVLCQAARDAGIGLTVDAEEADRLEPSLEIFERVSAAPALAGWDGLGLAVQAYQKRAGAVIDWLEQLARAHRRRIMVRLVKGAYWDTEIKRAQQDGLAGYPVFTRKVATDVSFIACARKLLARDGAFFPQFATHNAQTVAVIIELAGKDGAFEFQRLHGMGEALYEQLAGAGAEGYRCRVYAPVGSHEDLLPYLVRRLLENGANTSFVNRIVDDAAPIEDIIEDPVAAAAGLAVKPHPMIPLPADLFRPGRRNSAGVDLADAAALEPLAEGIGQALKKRRRAACVIGGAEIKGKAKPRPILDPADRRRTVGTVIDAGRRDIGAALKAASAAAPEWERTPAEARAAILDTAGDLFEEHRAALIALLVREGGKTITDAVAEVREAVDFCRYYAVRAAADFALPLELKGPTGEDNRLGLAGRGVFACISPWNFPLAIFCGQVTAALAAGNAVIAKPAEQTPLIARYAVRLLHQAGVPGDVLHLLPGAGEAVGARLVADPRIDGVAFTGSTETARAINQALAARPGAIVPLIAETGGQNAMIVDSSALAEQVVADVISSSFLGAGQRCSSLRVLFVQQDIVAGIVRMLTGAMAELVIGDPGLIRTDIGPVIDEGAREALERHGERMAREGELLYQCELGKETRFGSFFAPRLYRIERLDVLEREVFGPILHLIPWRTGRLDSVISAINGTGYGLTLGIHSRIDGFVDYIRSRVRVGNIYVNRDMVGAVVGVQPFGGEGLSGTGPKAGGPHYLHRFATERTVSVDTTAAGGNASLLTLNEDGD